MKAFIIIFVVSICLFFDLECMANDTVKLHVQEHPPFFIRNSEGWTGLNVELFTLLSKKSGVEFELYEVPWVRAHKEAVSKPIVLTSITPTFSRGLIFELLGPIFKEKTVFVSNNKFRESVSSFRELIALAENVGLKVYYIRGAIFSKEFEKLKFEYKKFDKYFQEINDYESIDKMLESNRILGYFDLEPSAAWRLSILEAQSSYINSWSVGEVDVYIGLSKVIPKPLLKKMQAAHNELAKENAYEKIYYKWTKKVAD